LPDVPFGLAEWVQSPQRRHRARIGRDRHAWIIHKDRAGICFLASVCFGRCGWSLGS
jgi:hypothetical protein